MPTSAPLAVKLLKNGTLKTYKDLPARLCSTHPEIVNRGPSRLHSRRTVEDVGDLMRAAEPAGDGSTTAMAPAISSVS